MMRKAIMIGITVSSDPVITRLKIGSPPAVRAWASHSLRPTVSGYQRGLLSMISGRK